MRASLTVGLVSVTLLAIACGGDADLGELPPIGGGGSGGAGGASFVTSATGAGGGTCGDVPDACATDADCDDKDSTTTDSCVTINSTGEFPTATCVNVPCTGDGCATAPVDPTCTQGNTTVVYPAYTPLNPPGVPGACLDGFELTRAEGAPPYVLKAKTPAGSRALTLDLDFATYTAPDGVRISGNDGSCEPYLLFETCRMKTADQPETAYGTGSERPDDVAIRQFKLELREGTTELTINFENVTSPMYLRVLGLCDFDITPAEGVKWFATVP
jgi:hypothetical protein